MAVEVSDDALLLVEAALKFEKLFLLFCLALDVFLRGLLVDLLEDEGLGRGVEGVTWLRASSRCFVSCSTNL